MPPAREPSKSASPGSPPDSPNQDLQVGASGVAAAPGSRETLVTGTVMVHGTNAVHFENWLSAFLGLVLLSYKDIK